MNELFSELVDRYDCAVNAMEQCLTRYAVTRNKGRREERDRDLAPLQARVTKLRHGILDAYDVARAPGPLATELAALEPGQSVKVGRAWDGSFYVVRTQTKPGYFMGLMGETLARGRTMEEAIRSNEREERR